MIHTEWLAERRRHVTATDVAAICGLNKYRGPLDVWIDKTGRGEPVRETIRMRRGRHDQPLVLDLYEERTGDSLRRYGDHELVVSPAIPWAAATPDAEVATVDGRLVEAKAPGEQNLSEWGEDGTQDVPEMYLIQVAWQMLVTRREAADLAAILGNDFRVYPFQRNADLENALVEKCGEFWERYVLAGVAPPVDGSESSRNWLLRQYPKNRLPLLDPTSEALDLMATYPAVKAALDRAEGDMECLKSQLMQIIGDAEGIAGVATWRKCKDSRVTDWKAAGIQMIRMLGEDGQRIADECTTVKLGPRRFLFCNGKSQ